MGSGLDFANYAGWFWSYRHSFCINDWFLFRYYWRNYNRWTRDPSFVWLGKFFKSQLIWLSQIRLKDYEFINICFRGAVLTERERNELNNQGIRILNTKAIEYSTKLIYRGYSYDQLRKVSKFEAYYWFVAVDG